jgi:hypothetical protein
MQGDKPENMLGYVRLDSLYFVTDSSAIRMDSALLTAGKKKNNETLLSIKSPFVNAQIEGFYNPATFVQTAGTILHAYLPSLFDYEKPAGHELPNSFSFAVTLGNTGELTNVFHLPVTINQPSFLSGEFREQLGEMTLNATFPDCSYNQISMKETTVFIGKKNSTYIADIHSGVHLQNMNPFDILLHTETGRDSIFVDLKYSNAPADFALQGEIKTFFSFRQEMPDNKLAITANFLSSNLVTNDLNMEFQPATVIVRPDKIQIHKFGLVQDNRLLFGINGTVSNSERDTLQVSIKEASIANLLKGFDFFGIIRIFAS